MQYQPLPLAAGQLQQQGPTQHVQTQVLPQMAPSLRHPILLGPSGKFMIAGSIFHLLFAAASLILIFVTSGWMFTLVPMFLAVLGLIPILAAKNRHQGLTIASIVLNSVAIPLTFFPGLFFSVDSYGREIFIIVGLVFWVDFADAICMVVTSSIFLRHVHLAAKQPRPMGDIALRPVVPHNMPMPMFTYAMTATGQQVLVPLQQPAASAPGAPAAAPAVASAPAAAVLPPAILSPAVPMYPAPMPAAIQQS
eukprot:GAFH01003109.1.p1 GENE.GAFH01003109.1~~GAFH01003109.1.p1  ORF type:complete len:263 (-),score=33.90 GAFH01003109.1:216-968(-)